MFNLRQLTIILTTVTLALAQNFDWDCTNSPGPCNNACFAINCKGSPGSLTYDSNAANRGPRRTASGCNRTPCTNTRYRSFGNSCDEYPFASTTQGGAGTILRCVDSPEISSTLYNNILNNQIDVISFTSLGEGGQLGNFYKGLPNGHKFSVVMKNYASV